MLRVLLALVAIGSGAMIGYVCAAPFYRRARTLRQLQSAVLRLNSLMLEAGESAVRALNETESGLFHDVAAQTERFSLAAAWKSVRTAAVKRGGALDSLEPADLGILDSLFSALGATGRKDQRRLLEGSATALQQQAEAAQARLGEKGRLYTTLGLLAGAALVMLFF